MFRILFVVWIPLTSGDAGGVLLVVPDASSPDTSSFCVPASWNLNSRSWNDVVSAECITSLSGGNSDNDVSWWDDYYL